MVWDFDKTLIKGYSQTPLFNAYEIDANSFWAEVNQLREIYEKRDLLVGADTAYLNHILTYVAAGKFPGLTNQRLVELGAGIEMSAGIPEFLPYIIEKMKEIGRYTHHGITIEHYVVSTGIRHLIEGSPIGRHVKRIWANEFIDQPRHRGTSLRVTYLVSLAKSRRSATWLTTLRRRGRCSRSTRVLMWM